VELATIRHRVATAIGKCLLERWYVQAYREQLPLDEDRLRYYLAWAAFRRLCRWGTWLQAGPLITGSKPASIRHVRPERIDFLCQAFRKRSGVTVRLY
jgi:hypothetical protein